MLQCATQASLLHAQVLSCNAACRITNDDGLRLTCISNFNAALTVRELSDGDELFVNYGSKDGFESSAFEMFIDYGFVPQELMELSEGAAGFDESDDQFEI